LRISKASATDWLAWGTVSESRGGIIYVDTPFHGPSLDIPILGTTLYVEPAGGALTASLVYGVSQNPD
jgi:hypothetical protein